MSSLPGLAARVATVPSQAGRGESGEAARGAEPRPTAELILLEKIYSCLYAILCAVDEREGDLRRSWSSILNEQEEEEREDGYPCVRELQAYEAGESPPHGGTAPDAGGSGAAPAGSSTDGVRSAPGPHPSDPGRSQAGGGAST